MNLKENSLIYLILIISIVLNLYFVYSQFYSTKYYRTSSECLEQLRGSNKDYVMCCQAQASNETVPAKFYVCNGKMTFNPNDRIFISVNLQRLNKNFDPYFVCGTTELNEENIGYGRYTLFQLTSNLSVTCSTQLSQLLYYHLDTGGTIPSTSGPIKIAEVRAFPNGNYTSPQDFFNNIDKSVVIFNLTGDVT